MEEGEKVCIPCEQTADEFRNQAITSNGRPGPGRDVERTIIPGFVVELAYPGIIQVTGGGNEGGVWHDKIGVLDRLENSERVLGQPYALEYLPRVGLCSVVDEVKELLQLGQFVFGRLAAPLEGDGAGFALICAIVAFSVGQKTLAATAPGTAAVTLDFALGRY